MSTRSSVTMPDEPKSGAGEQGASRWLKPLKQRSVVLALLILSLSLFLSFASPYFLTATNLTTVATGMIFDLLVASGMTLVLILGGIDLSVGSILGLSAVITTLSLQSGASIPVSIFVGLFVAGLCGAINGFGVAYLRIAPFIVTLGMMSIARGIATVLTSGYFVSNLPPEYLTIGQGTFLRIPYPVYLVVFVLIVLHLLLKNWKPFQQMYYVGNNPVAARLSGIRVRRLLFVGFLLSGLLAGVAAVFMTSRLAMGFFQFGLGIELTAIAAAVIGGASLNGGTGSIFGTFLGVLLLAIINNGFILLNGSPNWQSVVSGLILVAALIVDAYRRRKEERD